MRTNDLNREDFGDFIIDFASEVVIRDGNTISLRPQSFQVLTYLVENRGQLVTKQALFDSVWGDTVVTDDSLTQCLVEIRKALGQRGRHLVRTLPRRGYIFEGTSQDQSPEDASPKTLSLSQMIAAGALVLALLLIIFLALWLPGEPTSSQIQEQWQEPPMVVAVLPFEDFTQSGENDYLGYGLAEETLNRLTLVPGLQVIARTSSFAIARNENLTMADLAESLGATHVVEGSIREQSGNLRITAQLIETSNGYHLWSESFDRSLQDPLRVQDQIATAITKVLRLGFDSQKDSAAAISTEDHDQYLRASFLLGTRENDALGEARQLLEQVIGRNPQHLPSAEKLFHIYRMQYLVGEIDAAQAELLVEKLAESLETFEPAESIRHTALGASALTISADLPRAARHLSTAYWLSPNDPTTLRTSGELARQLGRFDAAISLYNAALALDPLCGDCYIHLAHTYMMKGSLGKAERAVREFMKFTRGGHFSLALIQTLQGEFDAAAETLAQPIPAVLQPYKNYYQALLSYASGDTQTYIELRDNLETHYADREPVRIAQLHAWGNNYPTANEWARLAVNRFPTRFANSLQEAVWGELAEDETFRKLLYQLGRAPEQLQAIAFEVEDRAIALDSAVPET